MEINKETCSVALCTYNGATFLNNQLQSIFQQTFPISELVICDDCSIDDTIPIINNWDKKYPGIIKLYQNPANLGGKKNFEKALSLCTGDIIFFSDQDDIWEDNKVADMLIAFRQNPEIWGIGTNATLVDENGTVQPSDFWKFLAFDEVDFQHNYRSGLYQYILSYGNIVAGATLALRQEAKPFICPFQAMEAIWHDEWIVLILSSLNRFMLMDKNLIRYRIHVRQQLGLQAAGLDGWLTNQRALKNKELHHAQPLFILISRWFAYSKVKKCSTYIDVMKDSINIYKCELEEAKKLFVNKDNFFLKKARLVKWYICREFETTINNIINY